MGLFNKKKSGETQSFSSQQPVMPEFPDVPELEENAEDQEFQFSTYEPSIADIKNQVDSDDFSVPPEREHTIKHTMTNKYESASSKENQISFSEEKPVFVRMDNYKEALKQLKSLKEKIDTAQNLLSELDSVREEEERKLEEWRRELSSIKEKILSVEKQLFEE